MGAKSSNSSLKVGTLNYSGILASPYEYYDQQNEREKLYSSTFTEVVSKTYPTFNDKQTAFKWKVGGLGKKWKTNRYCPLMIVDCGVNKKTNMMMNEEEFLEEWQRWADRQRNELQKDYFDKKYPDVEKRKQAEISEFNGCRQFDLLSYQSIIQVIYGKSDLKNLNVPADKYLQEREPLFNKSYLNEEQKIKITIDGILKEGFDCFFLQEANKGFLQAAKEGKIRQLYLLVQQANSDSALLLKKETFGNRDYRAENEQFVARYAANRRISQDEVKKILNFNGDSIFQPIDNLIFFSIHLNSDPKVHTVQLASMKQQIYHLMKFMPEMHVICGGDLNTQLKQEGFEFNTKQPTKMNVYPDYLTQITANKKRTMMQQQRHKADEHNSEAKDFIFSDLRIENARVQLIDGKQMKESAKSQLIPTNSHPYDHYMVTADIVVPTQSKNKPITC